MTGFRRDTYKENEMSLTVKDTSPEQRDYQILEAGTHLAICVQIIDFGPQRIEYAGQVKEQNKVRLAFEVPAERIEYEKDGEKMEGPMMIGKTYTASLFEKATLCQHLEGWRGRKFTDAEKAGFDLTSVLNKPCMLNIVHNEYQGKTYANIAGISKVIKGMSVPDAENPLISFDFDDHTPQQLAELPTWMQEKVADGKVLLAEQRERARNDVPPPITEVPKGLDADDSDIPF